MKRKNYKALIMKLFGTALGLVVMLSGATFLGQKFLVDHHGNLDVNGSSKSALHPDLELDIELNRQFGVITESGIVDIKATLKDARQTLVDIKLNIVTELNDTIREVELDPSIPAAIKKNVIVQLERELQRNERRLKSLEERALQFSYKMILPKSNYARSSKCNEEIIMEETHDTDLDADTKGNDRDVRKAFSWI